MILESGAMALAASALLSLWVRTRPRYTDAYGLPGCMPCPVCGEIVDVFGRNIERHDRPGSRETCRGSSRWVP